MMIRKATLNDSQTIADLIEKLAVKFIVHEFTDEGRATFLNSNNTSKIHQFIEQGFDYHVAEDKDEIVGVIGIRDNSHLYHLFVAESHQGQGLARVLWEHARERCLSRGYLGNFTVNSSNNAVQVYEAFGFVRTSGVKERNGVLYNPMKLDLD